MDTVTASAPGRVNLIGEHLDYNGGRCLPIAIDRRTTATVRRAPVDERRSGAESPGWTRYVDGVLAELGVAEPLAIEVSSTVPVGAGLSSSAALTCSIALAVNELLNLGRTRDQLIEACVRAENDYVGVPTGGMDQAAAFLAEPGGALLLDFGLGVRAPVGFDPGAVGLDLLVVDTGVSHQLASSEYATRRAEAEQAASELDLIHLAQANYEQLSALSNDTLRRRARHVVTEQYRVECFLAALHHQDWVEVGGLMTASHLSLRDDYEVSCPELDVVVTAALSAGAWGARMTGGGFGGAAIVLCRAEETASVRSRIVEESRRVTQNAPTLYRVEASGGASVQD